jgi:hypothetical protein
MVKFGSLIDSKKKEMILKRIHEGKGPLFMEKKPAPEPPKATAPPAAPVTVPREIPRETALGVELQMAINAGFDDDVAKLLKKGANPNYEDFVLATPLMHAAKEGHCGIIHLLLTSGAEIGKADIDGRTALMYAAISGQTKAAKQLVKNGANIDAKDTNDKTAGMLALENNFPVLARILGTDSDLGLGLEYGGDDYG